MTLIVERAYASPDEMLATLSTSVIEELTLEAGEDVPSRDANVVLNLVILDASRAIDGWLGGRYALPITDEYALAILRPHALAWTKKLLMDRRLVSRFDQPTIDSIRSTEQWLIAVVARKAALYGASEIPPTDTPLAGATTCGGNDPVFTDPNDTSANATGGLF